MRQLDYISLIHKELTGEISSEESRSLSDWLKSDSRNFETYEEVRSVWEASDKFEVNFTPNVELAFQKQLERINSEKDFQPKVIRMKPYLWVKGIAAALVFLVSALVIWNYFDVEKISATNEIVQHVLEDGSKIWLNKGATLEIDNNFGENDRKLKLKGEAYFDVARNEDKPFIIQAGDLNVEVLGTSFNVRSSENIASSVAVSSGRVKVVAANEPIILTKGEYVKLNNEGQLIKTNLSDSNEFTWKDGVLKFDDTPIIDALEDIASFYGKKLKIENVDPHCTVSTTKDISSSFENTMKSIALVNEITWQVSDENTLLITSSSICK